MLQLAVDTHLYPHFPVTSLLGLEENLETVFMNCKRVWLLESSTSHKACRVFTQRKDGLVIMIEKV